jgi:hypothetical protein
MAPTPNILFNWRRHDCTGLLGSMLASPLLMAVTIADALELSASHAAAPGRIEIVPVDAIARIDGAFDSATLHAVQQNLQP